jgi:peptide/nickel transport system permease protein
MSISPQVTGASPVPSEATWWRSRQQRRWRKYLPVLIVAVMVVSLVLKELMAPWLSPFSPSAQFSNHVLQGPGAGSKHWLGTDEFGRDLLSRLIWGARVSLEVGLASVLVSFALGVPLGIAAGYFRGAMEACIMRGTDVLLALPTLLLALVIVAALGGSLLNEVLAIGVALVPNFVRLARSLTLTISESDYILAARALGGSSWRIMLRHVFPTRYPRSWSLPPSTLRRPSAQRPA